ncbi:MULTISPECIES: hypothetical protein [unclassified Gilliamella]|uniref:hypothetical protein n=1 Tax=unclassified Gilliamella TaxID=2685620 RepID=UPI000810DFDD|nr:MULTISPECIES: hypothetical protein [Gilliamella]MCX8582571.1 hypothetical protein [Gilliamella sp. B3372]MCX8594346.1 hypothetical protein [Gilliamella sp. B3367]MCX8663332.1 hypothetical protein [Gilliamella sp. B2911]MCX8671275.1 hypothetical protein [Gilliamella sp. B2785]MCX8675166.1 hypothetical protein [Gilliamella sp. B3023]
MELAIGGVIVNWLGVLIVYLNSLNNSAYQMLLPLVIISALISTLGILFAKNNQKLAGTLIIIGSILFIPLGLIGIFGGRKIINKANEKTLEERRNL